jgi:hypothetical protein
MHLQLPRNFRVFSYSPGNIQGTNIILYTMLTVYSAMFICVNGKFRVCTELLLQRDFCDIVKQMYIDLHRLLTKSLVGNVL